MRDARHEITVLLQADVLHVICDPLFPSRPFEAAGLHLRGAAEQVNALKMRFARELHVHDPYARRDSPRGPAHQRQNDAYAGRRSHAAHSSSKTNQPPISRWLMAEC